MDMNFIFECSTRYLASERMRSLVRYRVRHKKIKQVCNTLFNIQTYFGLNYDIFDDFLKISDHFPKIS